MIDQLEAELRDAFQSKASNIPAEVSGRIRAATYRPRVSRWSPRVTYGAVAGAAITTATVVSAVVLGSASPAFAGWSATPTVPTGDQVAQAQGSCQQQLANRPAGLPATGGDPILTDVRGPFTVVIYATATSSTTCFTGPTFTSVSGLIQRAATLPAAGTIDLSTAGLTARDASPYTLVDGRTGAGVTGVSLLLDNGQHVQATLANGWYEAWWPGSARAVSAAVTTPGGTTTQTPSSVPVPCMPGPQAPCSGRSAGSGTSTGSGTSGTSVTANGSGGTGPMNTNSASGGAGTASAGGQP